MKNERIYFFDNCKGILIFLVVFGHLLNITGDALSLKGGIIIYFFHVPLLVFCSGYFADSNPSKILKKNLYPYIVFQTIYLLFAIFYLKENRVIQYTNPYWLLWYLFALSVWRILIPFINVATLKGKIKVMVFLVICSLLIGFDSITGYYLSASRIIVFFPFFALSYFLRQEFGIEAVLRFFSKKSVKIISFVFFLLCLSTAVIFSDPETFDISWLYGGLPYKKWHYSIWMRSWFLLCAFSAIPMLFCFVTNKKSFLTRVGQRSLYVYLIHGFFVHILMKIPFPGFIHPVVKCLIYSVILVIVLTSGFVVKLFYPLTDADFFKKFKRSRT